MSKGLATYLDDFANELQNVMNQSVCICLFVHSWQTDIGLNAFDL